MNLQNNFTRLDKNLKEVLEKWDKKILPFLPECLDGPCFFPFWRTTEASTRSTFFVFSKPDMSGFERNDDNRKCKISYKKQDDFEKCFLHEVSEISDIPSA